MTGALAGAPAIAVVACALGVVASRRTLAARRVRARLDDRAPDTVPGARISAATVLAGAAGGLVGVLALGPPAVVALVAVAAGLPVQARLRRRNERRRRRDAQLPTALDRLAAALRTGASLTTALDEVGASLEPPLGPELAALAHDAARGRPIRDVLDGWVTQHGDAGTRLAASALVLATLVGSAPARAIDGVAATVRERLDLAHERRALAAQARTSALVLSVAPVAFAALLILGDTAAAAFLLGSPAGWLCLVLGCGLDAAGIWWMTRLSDGGSS